MMPVQERIPTKLSSFVWYFLKVHKLALVRFGLVAIVWTTEMCVSPYLMKVLIDIVNNLEEASQKLVGTILLPAILYASMSLIMNINFRFYEHICLRISPQIKRSVTNTMFSYLSKYSHAYFQNHFSGTLVNKLMF